MKMEILLEPTSNKLMIILTKARNHVKKILLKLNLSDHRKLKDEGEVNRDTLMASSPKFDSLLEEFFGELTHTDLIPLGINEAFYDDHVKEISSGSTTTHSDSSLYYSFIFDLSINPFPPADRSDFYEFVDELTHIISPPEYDCFFFKIEPNLGDFTMDVVEDIYPTKEPRVHNALPTHPTFQLNLDFILSSESLFVYVVWIFLFSLIFSCSSISFILREGRYHF
nr:hypothetical protein [Tanacetum cinerariifolium]